MTDTKKGTQGKAGNSSADSSMCKFPKCRGHIVKYGFCADHFDQFKFGLLTKHGEHVPDFDKKIDHYMRQKGKSKIA